MKEMGAGARRNYDEEQMNDTHCSGSRSGKSNGLCGTLAPEEWRTERMVAGESVILG